MATALAALAAPLPWLGPVWLLAGVAVLAVALIDIGLSLGQPVLPAVTVASVVRLTKDRAGEVLLTLTPREGGILPVGLRLAMALPGTFRDAQPDVLLPAKADLAKPWALAWATTPSRRGRTRGVLLCGEVRSRWGCWLRRERRALETEIRVYPNLMSEQRALAAIFLDRGGFGSKLQRLVGRGRDFEKLRDYQPGDSYDEIHWKATAKRNSPITKVFQAERTQEIYVIIDASRLSARLVEHDGISQTVLERYLTATLILLLAAERQGDRFGLMVYTDRVQLFVRAGKGSGHFAACREAIHALEPDPGTPDLREITRYVRTHLRQRALLFFLTDLTDPVLAEDMGHFMPAVARQHLVMINQLQPPGVQPLFGGPELNNSEELYQALAGQVRWDELQNVTTTLRAQGMNAQLLTRDVLATELVSQYLKVKQKQAL